MGYPSDSTCVRLAKSFAGKGPSSLRVEGTYTIDADSEAVWRGLLSPDVLSSCIPGCQKFEPAGEDTYDVVLRVGVGAIRGTYTGVVSLSDVVHLESYKMHVEGRGSGGTVTGEGVIRISARDGATEVSIVGDAQVTGIVARVGQRFLGSASKMLMNQFFSCVKDKIEGQGQE